MSPRAFAALAVSLALAACGAAPDRPEAPDFAHPDLAGNTVRLSELRGRTVVIDFWATWCLPCAFQPAELNRVWQAHREAGQVVVLGVEVSGASAEEVAAWGQDNDAVADYPLLLGADEDLARRFGALGFPATAVVDPAGRIHSLSLGVASAEEIEAAIAAAAGGASGPSRERGAS